MSGQFFTFQTFLTPMSFDEKGGETMNVTSLFFATNTAQGGGNGTSRKEVGEAVFADVFSQTIAQSAPPAPVQDSSSEEIPWQDVAAKSLESEELPEEEVVEEIVAMLAQAMQTVSPETTQESSNGQTVTMNLNFTVENMEQLENLVKDLHVLFAKLGFNQEEIQKAIKVNLSAEELGAQLAALVTPNAEIAPEGFFQTEQTISLSLSLELPKTMIQPSSEGQTMAEALSAALKQVQTSLEATKTTESPSQQQQVQQVPPAPVVQEDHLTLAQTEVKETVEAPEELTAPKVVQTQVNNTTTKSETTENTVLVIKTDKSQQPSSEPTTSKESSNALRALAQLLAENTQEGVKVEVQVRAANQDQNLEQTLHQVTEEARVVLEQKAVESAQLSDGEKADLLVMALQKRKLEGGTDPQLLPPMSLAETAKLSSELKTLTARISLSEDENDLQLKAEIKASKLTLGTLGASGAYGQALGRLVKLQPVSDLLKDLSLDSAQPSNLAKETGLPSGTEAQITGQNAESTFAFDLSQAALAMDRGGVVMEKAMPRETQFPLSETWTLPQAENEARQALISKLSSKMQHLAASGAVTNEVRIALKPEHLGDLRIVLETHEGSVKASFIVESLRVKEILQAGFNTLRNDLQEAGIKLENFQVSVRDERQSQEQAWGREGGQGRPGQQQSGRGEDQPAFRWEAQSHLALAERDEITVNVFV